MSVPDAVEKRHDDIEMALGDLLEEQWATVLDQWSDASSAQRAAVREDASALRDRMRRALLSIGTIDDLERGLAVQYVEAKCHWTMLNLQIQHQTAQSKTVDDRLLYRATCVSLIVQRLESLLDPDRVDALTEFLAEPLE